MQAHIPRMRKSGHPPAVVHPRRGSNKRQPSSIPSTHDQTVRPAWPMRIFLGVVVLLAASGGWFSFGALQRYGVLTGTAAQHDHSAQHDSSMRVPGGILQVDQVIPEHMVPMQHDKFANAGMTMSAMGMDMAPEGFQRFTVEITLVGQSSNGLRYTADQFWIEGDGVSAAKPIRHQLGNGVVPAGSSMSGTLTFEAPEAARQLQLRFEDTAHSIAIELEPTSGSHHGTDEQDQSNHD